ncbi:MAG: hypothetical protein OXN86_04640 [Chloroflexota bacterium]|nr:hypothetical protein [Chloroflexota bacterium]MDE2891773.1 hypothetical protein [Chloroflexota bacterium]
MSILTTRPAIVVAVIAAVIVTGAVLLAANGDTVTTDVRINARQLADGRVEFALEHQGGHPAAPTVLPRSGPGRPLAAQLGRATRGGDTQGAEQGRRCHDPERRDPDGGAA